jgi:hypothetical protein
MRKITLTILCICFLISFVPLFGDTSITGSYGYFTMPITSTPSRGTIHINSGYIFDPGNFYISLNTSILKNWELSAGKEILTREGGEIDATPFVIGTKYLFYQKGDFRAAAGLQVDLLLDQQIVDGTPVSLYGVISESAGKIGYVNIGLGYTLGIDAGYAINFFVGLRKAVIGDKLFVIGEFTNYSVRQGLGLPWNEGRGIFNGGVVLELTDFLKFKFTAYDLLDHFLTVGLGAELRLKAF